mgnify:CR=1 FL=1
MYPDCHQTAYCKKFYNVIHKDVLDAHRNDFWILTTVNSRLSMVGLTGLRIIYARFSLILLLLLAVHCEPCCCELGLKKKILQPVFTVMLVKRKPPPTNPVQCYYTWPEISGAFLTIRSHERISNSICSSLGSSLSLVLMSKFRIIQTKDL